MSALWRTLWAVLPWRWALLSLVLLTAACPGAATPADGATPDLAPPLDLACYTNPRTHNELLNACTDAQSLDKTVRLPLLRPDGTLPPLP